MLALSLKLKMQNLPYVGDKQKAKNTLKRLGMAHVNYKLVIDIIQFFRWHNQFHEIKKLLSLMNYLNPEEAELFDVDVRKIDLALHAKQSLYGIGKYYNGLDLLPPNDPLQQILKLNSLDYNHDIKVALNAIKNFKSQDLSKFTQSILNAQKFQNFLEQCFSPHDVENKQMSLNSLKNLPTVAGLSKKMI
jgi:hypothetical protein